MAEFQVCKFDGDQAYRNAKNLKNDLVFGSLGESDEKFLEERRSKLSEMFEYAPQVWEVDSWEKAKEYLEEYDYTMWRELGELEERIICEKCGATMMTNSNQKVREARDTHQIQTCTSERR